MQRDPALKSDSGLSPQAGRPAGVPGDVARVPGDAAIEARTSQTPLEERPRRGDSSEVPEKLLRAAGPIFARVGFGEATVREICRSADTNVASVAYYFGDKMGLYRAVIARMRESRERAFPVPPEIASSGFGATAVGDCGPASESSRGGVRDAATDAGELTGSGAPDSSGDEGDEALLMLLRVVHTLLSRMFSGDASDWHAQMLLREMLDPTEVFGGLVSDYFRPLFERLKSAIRAVVRSEGVASRMTETETEIEQLAIAVVSQCVYYRISGEVLRVLVDVGSRGDAYTLSAVALQITAATHSGVSSHTTGDARRRLRAAVDRHGAADWFSSPEDIVDAALF